MCGISVFFQQDFFRLERAEGHVYESAISSKNVKIIYFQLRWRWAKSWS